MIRPLAAQFVALVGLLMFRLGIAWSASQCWQILTLESPPHRDTKTVMITVIMTADHSIRPLRPTRSIRMTAGTVPKVKHMLKMPAKIALILESSPFWLKLLVPTQENQIHSLAL